MKAWLIAGGLGVAVLAVLLPRHHDVPVRRVQLEDRTRQLASRLGWDTQGWGMTVAAVDEQQWRRLRAAFPESELVEWLPRVRYRVHARGERGDGFRAEFGDAGQLMSFSFTGARTPPEIDAARLPELFGGERVAMFRPFEPGAGPRPERPFGARRRTKGEPDGRPGEGEQPGMGGRPEWEWVETRDDPLALRIHLQRTEGQVRGARVDLTVSRTRRAQLRPPGDDVRGVVEGFGTFVFTLAMGWAIWRVLGQLGVRRDYLRVLFTVWGVMGVVLLALLLVGGPGWILRTAGLGGERPGGAEGFGFVFGLLVARPLALALPLAAGLLTIRGRHAEAWVGLAAAVLRRQLPWGAARGLWSGMAAGPALAAVPYLVAAAVPGKVAVTRPEIDLLAHPFPAFEVLRRFPVDILGGVLLFGLLMPWMLRGEAPSKLRRVLFVVAGILMIGQRMHWLADHGWAAVGSLPLWLGASWFVLGRAGMLGLLGAWLGAALTPVAGVYLMAPYQFPLQWAQCLALYAAPAAVALWAVRRVPMLEQDEVEFVEELERRNHPDTAPRLKSEREYLLSEFALAREAQEGMLPDEPPRVPGYSLAARCIPAREVGGDLFDFLPLPGGRLGLCVADVSGKGVPAALYMTLTKGMLAAEQDIGSQPRQLARTLNAHLLATGKRRTFVTLILAVLSPETGGVEIVRAGHNPALLWRARTGEAAALQPRGIGLGLAADSLFNRSLDVYPMDLEAGDVLLLYSDGLTEAMNHRREMYGERRLEHAMARYANRPGPEVMAGILEDVERFTADAPSHDDLTLLVVKRESNGAG
jgi:serine phosphatase RsbU (regulator of sigma subunit)